MFGGANYAATANVDGLSDKEIDKAYSVTVGDFHVDQLKAVEGVKAVRVASESAVTVSSDDDNVSGELITGASDASMLPVRISQGEPAQGFQRSRVAGEMAKQLGVDVGDTVTLTPDMRYRNRRQNQSGRRARGGTDRRSGRRVLVLWWCDRRLRQSACLMQGADDFNAVNTNASTSTSPWTATASRENHQRRMKALLPTHTIESRQHVSDEASNRWAATTPTSSPHFLCASACLPCSSPRW